MEDMGDHNPVVLSLAKRRVVLHVHHDCIEQPSKTVVKAV